MSFLFIGLAGSVGALSRYGLGYFISQRWSKPFPLPTLIINISGAFLLGMLASLYASEDFLRLTFGTGFLGAYTTFSTFSYECVNLLQEGKIKTAWLYIALSVSLGFVASYLGMYLVSLL